jgi:hypothetical protein
MCIFNPKILRISAPVWAQAIHPQVGLGNPPIERQAGRSFHPPAATKA